MLFTEFKFIVFYFIVFIVYWLTKREWRILFLTICSLIFYGAWDYRFLSLIIAVIIITHISCDLLHKVDNKTYRSMILTFSISSLLLILGIFKYYDFFQKPLFSLCKNLDLQPLNL